jgi:uncharacterized membrane protein YfcA
VTTAELTVIAAALVIFSAALVSSVAGFAFSALAGAALVRLFDDPARAVSVMVACSIAIQAYGVWALRHAIDWRSLRPFVAGGALTVPAGVWCLLDIDARRFAIGLGAFLIVYGIYMMACRRPPVVAGTACHDFAAGALGGFIGGLAGFPGSFVTIWCGMRGWSKERQRAVYQPYILVMQLETMALLAASLTTSMVAEMALYVPLALVAACLGMALYRTMSGGQFRLLVNGLLAASGVALLGGAI